MCVVKSDKLSLPVIWSTCDFSVCVCVQRSAFYRCCSRKLGSHQQPYQPHPPLPSLRQ